MEGEHISTRVSRKDRVTALETAPQRRGGGLHAADLAGRRPVFPSRAADYARHGHAALGLGDQPDRDFLHTARPFRLLVQQDARGIGKVAAKP